MNAKARAPVQDSKVDLPCIFTGVQVYRRDTAFIWGVLKSLDEARIAHTFVVRWSGGTCKPYMIQRGVTSQCVVDAGYWQVFSLSPEGTVHIATPGRDYTEYIDQCEAGPSALRWMLDIAAIGQSVFAAGMARMFYQRVAPNQWVRANQGAEPTDEENVESGFRSISGFGDVIVGVGFHGEIWERIGSIWRPRDSPTNVTLHCVRFTDDHRAFACGAGGVILKMDSGNWSIVEQDLTSDDFWSIQAFYDYIYFASRTSVYRLNKIDVLEEVDMGLAEISTAGHLHARDGLMWSVGSSDLVTFNGQTWTPVVPPMPPSSLSDKSRGDLRS